MKIFLLLLISIPSLLFAQTAAVATLLQEGKQLDESAHEEKALQKYLEALKLDPANYVATWNCSFLYSRIGNRETADAMRQEYFNLAKKYAAKALAIDSSNVASNYVMAVALGRMALISPAKEKVAASRSIKHYAERAIYYDPNHAGAYYVLGKWNYEVANLNFAERSAAKLLFGGIPNGSLDNAIKNFAQSIKLDPGYLIAYPDLAKSLEEKGYDEEAKKILTAALRLSPKTEDDPAYLQECRQMVEKLE
jgi:tetratricopeptide (TPR) repeat protein